MQVLLGHIVHVQITLRSRIPVSASVARSHCVGRYYKVIVCAGVAGSHCECRC